MKEDFEQILKEDFPDLFENLPLNRDIKGYPCFEHDEGWVNLIYSIASILVGIDSRIRATQVKEKLGFLRFYTNVRDLDMDEEKKSEIYHILDRAERISSCMCERCGTFENASLENLTGLYKVVCPDCKRIVEDERKS